MQAEPQDRSADPRQRAPGRSAAAERDDAELGRRLDDYAAAVGLSFQIVDDILDVVSDTETLGKAQGADIAARQAHHYPALLGLDGALARLRRRDAPAGRSTRSRASGASFEELRALSAFVVERTY